MRGVETPYQRKIAMKNLLLTTLMLSAAVFVTPASAADKLPPGVTKNIVLVPGAFADDSSWDNVSAILKSRGYSVTAVKLPLTSLGDDVGATQAVLDTQDGPTVLVGHSWGGFVIGEAGVDSKVTALVYVSAFAPDKGETVNKLSAGGPPSPGVQAIRPDDKGFLSIDKAAFPRVFGADLPKKEAEILADKQKPINHTAFDDPAVNAAWHVKPSWFVISNKDQVLDPSAQKLFAGRMKATTTIVEGGHDSLIAFPKQVAAVIEAAAAGTHKGQNAASSN
jgi:pimeloyl-ACP methyl ester carboxylesterase